MLKLNYTDLGLHMEYITASLDVVVAQYVLIAMRLGKPIHVEQSRASFLIPAESPILDRLHKVLRQGADYHLSAGEVAIAPVDASFVEVSVGGTWISESLDSDVGIFLASFGPQTEFLLHQLWQETQRQTSLLS